MNEENKTNTKQRKGEKRNGANEDDAKDEKTMKTTMGKTMQYTCEDEEDDGTKKGGDDGQEEE